MNSQDDPKLLEKQEFLSKEILEAGFDPEEFQDYMLDHSSKELDLNEWTIEELAHMVKKYKNQGTEEEEVLQKEQPKKEPEQPDESKMQKKPSQASEIQEMQSEGLLGNPLPSYSSSKHINIKKKTTLSELYILKFMQKKRFEVKIKKYSKTVPNNIFRSSYVLYDIETSEGWKVSRRFNDFIWLRKYFESAYNGLPIPPIPEKTAVRSFDERHIAKRMLYLEKFLKCLVETPQICSDPILELFLRAEEELFAQTKRKSDASQASRNDMKIETIWGQDLLRESQRSIQGKRCIEYQQLGLKYQVLCTQLENLQQSLRKVVSDSYLVSSTFQQIQSKLKSPKCIGIFNVMHSFFNQYGVHISRTIEQMRENLSAVWNYESMKVDNFNQTMFKTVKEQLYLNQKEKSLFAQGKEAPKSQKSIQEVKDFEISREKNNIKMAYLTRQLQRYQESNFMLIAQDWTKSLKLYISEISEWMIGCTDQLTRSMSLGEGKDLMEVEYMKT